MLKSINEKDFKQSIYLIYLKFDCVMCDFVLSYEKNICLFFNKAETVFLIQTLLVLLVARS